MSGYPTTADDRRVDSERLGAYVQSIFEHCEMDVSNARLLANSLLAADLRGVHSHGVMRVPEYVSKLNNGGVNPNGRPRIARDSGAVMVVDGDNSMGQIAAAFAMERAIDRAASTGIAAAAVGGSNHCGAMAFYALKAIPHDMIGVATTNALPTMAPWGGLDKILGINPLAVAIPTDKERPIVLDTAFAGSAHGKIRVFHQKGLEIPPHWAFDKEGEPTTDAAKAIEGLLQPIGQFKGVGLAVVMGILSTLLSGAAFGPELGSVAEGAKPGHDGHFFLALRVDAFGPVDEFKLRADGVVQLIRESRKKPGVERIYPPGALEFETEERYLREGIPLNRETLSRMRESAKTVGAPAEL